MPPQPGQTCLVPGSNQLRKLFCLSTSATWTVLHFEQAIATFSPFGTAFACSALVIGSVNGRAGGSACALSADARTIAAASPQIVILVFDFMIFYSVVSCDKIAEEKNRATHPSGKNVHFFGSSRGGAASSFRIFV